MKNPKECAKKKHTGRLCTLTMCQKDAIVCQACFEKQNSTKTEMNLLCTSQTVHNVLQKNSNAIYAELLSCPPLTKLQKQLRLESAKKHFFLVLMERCTFWFKKKKKNFDRSNSFCHYSYDLQNDNLFFPPMTIQRWFCGDVGRFCGQWNTNSAHSNLLEFRFTCQYASWKFITWNTPYHKWWLFI